MKASGRPIINALRGRVYSAQAATKPEATKVNLPKQELKVSKLPNGAIVASLDNYFPISRVGVFFNAGPRYESGHNIGITHCLRNAANLSTSKSSNFGISRNIQQIGGSLACTTTREHMVYTLDCIRDNLDVGIEYMGHVTTSPAFKTWEMGQVKDKILLDLALLRQQPEIRLIEALHKTAFRDTLGNSLYCADHKVGHFSSEQLLDYVSNHYTGANAAVVGVGVDHAQLVNYAQKHLTTASLGSTTSGDAQPEKVAYYGGQARVDTNSPFVHVAMVTQGASLEDKDMLALAVLQKAMGSGPHVKYSKDLAASVISQTAAKATTSPFAASCINFNYADSGLFGYHLVASAKDVGQVVKAVSQKFASITKEGLTDADIQRGKNQLKADLNMEAENGEALLEALGRQAALAGEVYSLEQVDAAINKITLSDVHSIGKKVINGKPTLAAVGDLSHMPHLEHLL